jgi:hypothetical protein
MSTNTYNGWTNYETWRIALEWFDGNNKFPHIDDVYELSQKLREYVEFEIEKDCKNSYTFSYAYAFVSEVNFYEIAQHLLEEVNNG